MVAYNSNDSEVGWTLPEAPSGTTWYAAMDTSSETGKTSYVTAPGEELLVIGLTYALAPRTVAVLVAR